MISIRKSFDILSSFLLYTLIRQISRLFDAKRRECEVYVKNVTHSS